MPICKRDGFERITSKGLKADTFQDNDEVFFCEITKEIFREYEDYFRHVMVINSTVWQCEATGRESLTYAEALKSERRARRKMEQFKESLRAPVMLVIEAAKQSSLKSLNAIVSKFLRNRYFINEEISAMYTSTKYKKYIIRDIIPNAKTPLINGVYEKLENLSYRLQSLDNNKKDLIVVPYEGIRRDRMGFTLDNLAMFIKCHVERIDGILHPKPEAYKKYVTDPKKSFSSIFIGKMPEFAPAKLKKPSLSSHSSSTAGNVNSNSSKVNGGDKKQQSTLNKYLVKNGEGGNANANTINGKENKTAISKAQREKEQQEREAKAKSLKEEMERLRLEKIQQLAEQKLKLLQKVEEDCDKLLNVTDDLERSDQRILPIYKPISTIIPIEAFGDALMICEFMHTFAGFLSGIEVFRPKISLVDMTRAFTVRELNGPLTNIFLILLGTIFDLQKEEEEENSVYYRLSKSNINSEPFESMAEAFQAHKYSLRYFSFNINALPIDGYTISEVLRLHLLASGCRVDDRADRWRVANRNGYSSNEDPGLELRLTKPEIIRKLKIDSIYTLPFDEILFILRCLMAQILTYSSPIALLEERKDEMIKARAELYNLNFMENKRLKAHQARIQELNVKFHQECLTDVVKNDPNLRLNLEQTLNKQIAEQMAVSDKARKKYEEQLEDLYSALFNYLVCLGTDRAYRKYYVLESVPGIFIENPEDCWDICLKEPPLNISKTQLSENSSYPKTRKELRAFLTKKYAKEEKENKLKNVNTKAKQTTTVSPENKENCEHQMNDTNSIVSANGIKTEGNESTNENENENENEMNPSQFDLFMCSGDPNNCIVHTQNKPERQRWTYIYEKQDLEALIESLNPLGVREMKLKEQLTNLKDLIENHIKKCPYDWLTIDKKNLPRYKGLVTGEMSRRSKTNIHLQNDSDVDAAMYTHLTNLILEFESEIYSGDLGRLKVKSMDKWREDLVNFSYDPQVKLIWGPPSLRQASGGPSINGEHFDYEEDSETEEVNAEEAEDISKFKTPYTDPGARGINAKSLEEYCNGDLNKLERLKIMQENVQKMASALLQVEQAIERRFIKYPFGPMAKDLKDKSSMEKRMIIGANRLKQWELSLMESTSFSQVFLHLTVLHDCITWSRSTNKSNCAICRKGNDPEIMLLCDECNAGTHMYCMKPKMKKVPEGNWYCKRCCNLLGLKNESDESKYKKRRKRNFIVDQEEEQDDEEGTEAEGEVEEQEEIIITKVLGSSRSKKLKANELEEMVNGDEDDDEDFAGEEVSFEKDEDESESTEENLTKPEENDEEDEDNEEYAEEEEEDICIVCSYEGSDLTCVRCKDGFHLECINLKRPPRYNFICNKCKSKEEKKKPKVIINDDSEEEGADSDIQEPPAKRGRPRNSFKKSLTNGRDTSNTSHNDLIKTTNGRRSVRRTGDNLPLNTAALYELLNDLMKHEKAWPFLRPVSQSAVPDYYEIIKTPMDLSKIKSKLNMGEYNLNEQVLSDLQLIFNNCDEYNVEGNEIYKAGSMLEKYVIERCNDLNLKFIPSEMQQQH